ncbi:MAG TPA: murein biosynthesis integral membrane protein MurJ [Mycobacteriales bacterium]|nr:murein biosynthesis integral membrane protein MurJ [Mycobacteriales bacterium]
MTHPPPGQFSGPPPRPRWRPPAVPPSSPQPRPQPGPQPDAQPAPGPGRPYDSEQTIILTAAQIEQYSRAAAARPGAVPADPGSARPGPAHPEPSLGRSSRIMMVATAGSRLTGFLRSLAIASAIGFGFVGDAYNTANTLPNIVYELLLGGVLTSVVVPLLVHAQHDDPDGGEAYTQRLLTLSAVVLGAATLVAVLAAPLLTALYVGGGSPKAHLTTLWAWLLLPEIFFYGVGAMFGAILNTRGVFGAPMWAPIVNNLVVVATAGLFLAMPGPASLRPGTITTAQVLVLGLGTTLGIVAQALVLAPYLRRVGFRWRFRMDLRNSRLGEAGTLALWVVGYVAVSQVGYVVQTRIANGVDLAGHSYAVFSNASLLFQMPYGILGVSLLTALMPRMSRAAARGDTRGVIRDLSLGSRLSVVALLPVTALLILLGPALSTVIFSLGRAGDGGRQVGVVLALSAFGLAPFAITMLQLRVFYAMKDARTPTMINIGMVLVKVALSLLVTVLFGPTHLVAGLAVATSLSYLVGAVIGEVALRRRFGAPDTARVLRTVGRMTTASALAVGVGLAVRAAVAAGFGTGVAGSAVALAVCTVVMLGVVTMAALALRVSEISEMVGTVRRRTSRT